MRAKTSSRRWVAAAVVVAAMAALAARPSPAGPSDYLKIVPGSHEAFVYIDVKQARNSETWQKLKTEVMAPNVQTGLAMVEQLTGMRLPDDLDTLVASGKVAQQNEGCVYVRGRFDRARLQSFVSMNPAYTETKVAGGTILGWLDEGKGEMTHGAFLRDDLLMIGQKSGIEAALAVAAGKEAALAENATARLLAADAATSPLALVMVVRPKTMPPQVAGVPVLQKVQSVLFQLTSAPGTLLVTSRIEAETQEIARQMADLVRGVVALGQLQEQRPKLAEIASRTTVSQKGTVVESRTSFDLASAETFLLNQIRNRRAGGPNVGGQRIRDNATAGEEKPVPPRW